MLTVYGRSTTNNALVNLTATVNDAQVKLIANPTSSAYKGTRIIFQATYFQTQNPLLK